MTEEVHFWQLVRDEQGQIKTWRLVDANPPTIKTWGRLSVEGIRGKTTDEIFGPGATEHYMPVVQKIFTENAPNVFEDYFPHLDKHFRFTSVPLGEFFITTGADITVIKKTELALRESEERLRLLGDNLPESALYQYTYAPDGTPRFTYFSAGIELLNGISVAAVLADAGALHRQILPGYFERLVAAEAESAINLSDFDMEVPMGRPDGTVRWMQLHSRPRRMPGGSVVWDGVQIDITERKRAEEALQATNREIEEFNRAMVGRELRMIELKQEINEVCAQLGRPPRYPFDDEEEQP
jgi:PAS domain S-box-containing protein